MATFAFKAVDLAGHPPERRDRRRVDKTAGHRRAQASAASRSWTLEEKKSGLADGPRARPQAGQGRRADGHDAPARDDDLVGHDAAARVLRARGADREQEAARDDRAGPRGHRGRPAASPTRSRATRRSSARSTSRWSAPARPAACSRSRSTASPTSSRRTTRCAARSSRAMVYPAVVMIFAMLVLLALIAFIVPVFVGRLQGLRRRAAADHEVHRRASRTSVTRSVVHPDRRRRRLRRRLQASGRRSSWGRPQWDAFRLQDPVQDRRHGPEDRARALVAHVLRALRAPACRSCRRSR